MAATVVPSVIVNLKVLSQDNYKEWSFRVKTYLLAEDLWEVVTDNPPDFRFNAWSRDNAKALHTIHISCGDNAYAFIEDISVAKEAWQILAKKFNPIEVSHDADIGSDIHTNQTPIDGDAGPNQDMEIEAIEDVGSDIHTNQALGDVGTKKDMGIEEVEGGESVNDNSIYKPFFENLDSSEWDAVMKFINIHPGAIRARHPLNGKTALHLAAFDERENIVKELVQLMTVKDLEIKDHDGATAFAYVVRCYDRRKMIEMVKCLVEKNKKLLAIVDSNGRTALYNAICAEEVDIVKEWVRLMTTEDLEIQDNDGDTALAHAVIREDTDKMIEIVKCLVEKNKKLLTIVDSTGKTPLHKAAFHEKVDIIKELVQLMTVKDLEIKDHDGATALAYIVRCYDRRKMIEMVKCLVEKNKKLLANVDSNGRTALYNAICPEEVDIVKEWVWLMTTEDLEIQDNDGDTALAHAVIREDTDKMIEIVKCLVEKNKKLLTIVDSTGKTPLHKAVFHEKVDIVKELVQLMTVKDLEIKDHDGATALAYVVRCYDTRKMIEMVKCLVEKNKKLLTIVDSTGKTPLHKAVLHEKVDIVKELVQLMTVKDLEIKDRDGATALAHVVRCYDTRKMIEMVKCLVEKNKKLLIVDFNVRTALYQAIRAEEVDIVKEWVRLMTTEDLEIQDSFGDTALAHSVIREDTDKMIEIVKCLVEKNKKLLTIVDSTGKTPLHKAVFHEKVDIVKELVQLMTVKDLEIKDHHGATALAYAVLCKDIDKMVKMVKFLVEKNKKLLTLDYSNKGIPLVSAFLIQDWKMATDIYSHTPLDTLNDTDAAALITSGVAHNFLDIPLDLIRHNPRLGITKDRFGRLPLLQLARTRHIFLSGSPLRFWEQWIYDCIHVEPTNINHIRIAVQREESFQGNQRHLIGSVRHFFRGLVRNLLQLLGINRIYQMKLTHIQALEILRRICEGLKTKLVKDMQDDAILVSAIFEAVELGQVEFIDHICNANPRVNNITNIDYDRSLFQFAVECRQEKIYNLIYRLGEEEQKDILGRKDRDQNKMIDIITSISSSAQIDHIRGAALQMQRELQWFQEVQSLESSFDWEEIKIRPPTPRQLFTQNHKDLLKEGEKSMKETATSSTVIGALIVTIMFAAAFTVPGGNGDKGFPNFLNQKAFKIFIASDAMSLFFSTTSVMIFLGMLTSRYAEDDFLKSLPTKMILGLSTLFISIAAMMIAFSSALILMLPGESWIALPSILLSTIPIASFVWMQFPLLVEIFISTYGAGPFDKKVQRWG